MLAERLGYRPWNGSLRSSFWRWWPIARSGMLLVFGRRIVWLFLALGLLNFLFYFAMVYFVADLKAKLIEDGRSLPPWVNPFTFTGSGKSYRDFIFSQATVVVIFLGFCGSILVGNDFRFRSVAFYLSRPIGKLHYFLGKLGAAAGLTALITLVPALVLFLEYGAFTDSLAYYRESQRIFWSILAYGALVSLASATLLLGVAALLERTIPILAAWCGILILLPLVGKTFRELSQRLGNEIWAFSLIDFWALLRWIGNGFFGLEEEKYLERLPWALLVLGGAMALALRLFWRRVQAVEVVR